MVETYDKKTIKNLAFHLKTIGAYVQTPIPAIVGLKDDEALASVDAKSLYPTEMCNGNIGYDSLYGRLYDTNIVGPTITYIKMIMEKRHQNWNIIQTATETFKKNFTIMVVDYCARNTVANTSDLKKFAPAYYGNMFYKILTFRGEFSNICQPESDQEYVLLKSCLFPLLEALTWVHKDNPGYNRTICNYIFSYPNFKATQQKQKFYLFDKINSTQTKFYELTYDQLIEYYFTKFNLNTYGTLFYKHYDYKSFEVDNIFRGMDSRKLVKDEMLILSSVTEHWANLTDPEKMSFYDTREKIDAGFAETIIKKVGDSDEKTRSKQLKSLLGININISGSVDLLKELTQKDTMDLIKGILGDIVAYKDSHQNGEKVSLNSGYGLYAMVNWDWSQVLVSNSITNAGKITGIKLFQQIASNIMRNERKWRGI